MAKAKSKTETSVAPKRKKKITDKDISTRAHLIYLERVKNGLQGNEESDWLQAEKELKEGKV